MSGTSQSVPPEGAALPARAGPERAQSIETFVFGPRPPIELSERTRLAIAESQRSSEVLVCLVQFAAIAFFGFVYALTPKGFPSSVPFEPVPVVLTVYAAVTMLRLWLAVTGRLGPGFLVASVVIDIGVLMLTIWSFHLQYQQPPAVYLKAPTLLYVFILIALRSMRLEARYVLLAGLTAMAGWAVLVLYAVDAAGPEAITRDWATYMTTGTILIGAEVDKILALGAVTALLAIAVTRARRLMITAAAEAQAAAGLSRFFAPEVAGQIRNAEIDPEAATGVAREAAVLLVDLRGFTRLASRMEPEQTIRMLSDYHATVVPVILRHGGSIDKYLGDGILATFGATRPSETAANDALAALREVIEEGERWSADRSARGEVATEVNAALDIGPIVFGVVGHADRLEVTVIGDVVNRVAKIEKHARKLSRRGLVSAAAVRAAARQSPDAAAGLMDCGSERIAGLEAPIKLFAASGGTRQAP